MESIERNLRKERLGVVVSDKMDKTITVSEVTKLMHHIYGKFMKRTKTYKAHDETNNAKAGDTVDITRNPPTQQN
jgi:small subunit ribosomal protein S17